MRVLVVDDDEDIRVSLRRALGLDGHEAVLARDGEEALAVLRAEPVDVAVLDRGLPGIDGLEVCRRIRSAGLAVGVLMLTAQGAVRDRVDGLDAGADDYMVKPYDVDELLARVRAVARRRPAGEEQSSASGDQMLRVADLAIDPARWSVRRGDRPVQLTRTEFRLLQALAERPGVVLGRPELMRAVWDYDFGTTSSNLDVYVSYLRRKLEAAGEPRLLHTVRGVGYTLRADA